MHDLHEPSGRPRPRPDDPHWLVLIPGLVLLAVGLFLALIDAVPG